MNVGRKKGITEKRRRFVDYLFTEPTQKAAAIKAGYPERSASTTAAELMKDPDVAELIELKKERMARRVEINEDRIMNELACMGFANIRDFVDIKNGVMSVKDMDEISSLDSAAIQEIVTTKTKQGTVTKIKLVEKKGPLELMGKRIGIFKDKLELGGPGGGPIEFKWADEEE